MEAPHLALFFFIEATSRPRPVSLGRERTIVEPPTVINLKEPDGSYP